MREEDNQDFEKAWQRKFAEWETPPPADALAKLQAELSNPKRFSGGRGWILRGLVVIILLLMFIPQSKDHKSQTTDHRLQAKNDKLYSKNNKLDKKDTQLQNKDTQLQNKNTQLQNKDTQLQNKDTQLLIISNKLDTNSISVLEINKNTDLILKINENQKIDKAKVDNSQTIDNKLQTDVNDLNTDSILISTINNNQDIQKTDIQVLSDSSNPIINKSQKADNQGFKYLINLLKPLDLQFKSYSFPPLNFANLKIDSLLAQKIISPRWFVSINFAPNFTYKQINPNPLDSIWIRDFEATRGLSQANLGWQVNVQISRQWHKNWEAYAGLGYARYRTHFNYQRWTRLGFNLYENVSGSEFTLIPQFKKDSINQNYIRQNGQLEAGIARRIGGNRFGHWLRLGIGVNFPQNISGFGQVSYQFLPRLSPRWQLSLSPYFFYQLNNQQLSDIGFQGKGYHLGFQVGIRYGW